MRPKIILTITGIALITSLGTAVVVLAPHLKIPASVYQNPSVQPGYYKVSYVSDGDTFAVTMDGHDEKVRLIGVDTPETVKPNSPSECYGKMASDFTKHTLSGQTVRLEADPINQNRDRYDRLLRYAYLPDGSLLNATLISQGYGFAYLSFPFTKAEEFRQLQTKAREQSLGVWSGQCTITGPDSDRPKSNQL